MSQLTPQKTKTCHQVKVLRFLLSSQLLNGIVCLTEDSQSWVCVRAGTGGAELPLDIFTIEGPYTNQSANIPCGFQNLYQDTLK